LIISNRTSAGLRFMAGLHLSADVSHKNMELDFRGITGIGVSAFGTLLRARSSVQDQVSPPRVKRSIMLNLLLSKILSMYDFYSRDLCIFSDDAPPPSMLVDNEQSIAMSQGPTQG
jgi:hypothetical protein